MPTTSQTQATRTPDPSTVAEQLAVLDRQVLALQEQLAEIRQQLSGLARQVGPLLEGSAAAARAAEPTAQDLASEVLADCAHDIVRVLHEVGRPLTPLEILDELVRRQLRWRENTVRHTLAELLDRGLVTTGGNTLHSYALAAHTAAAPAADPAGPRSPL